MAAHHHQSSSAAAYLPKQIADSMDEIQRKQMTDTMAFFMDEILAELAASSDVQDEFLELLCGFGKDAAGDADAVKSRAAELLRGHPDVLHRFTAFIYMDVPPEAERILASTRRRRTSRRTPAAHVAAAAARNDGDVDDGRPRRSLADALAFVKRVHVTAGPVVHGRFLAVLSEAKGSEDMAADEIYDRAKVAFGPAHVGLLHAFATVWLPGKEWKLQQQEQARVLPARQRRRTAAAAASMPPDAKKHRAHDGDNGRRHDHVIAVLEVTNVKKRRIGDGEFSGSAAAARVLGADATGVHHAYSGDKNDNDKKPPRRRVAIGGKTSSPETAKQQPERDGEVRRFRQEWEFQTWYSKLVATSDRVTELLRPSRTRHGDDGGGGGNSLLEELFPLPECREFLHKFYGDRWGEMRAALEVGESRVPALEAIERRLTAKEEEALVEELRKRCRHDPGRVAQRLHGLVMECYATDEECRRRQHHGGGGS